jgi:hypothetical protein
MAKVICPKCNEVQLTEEEIGLGSKRLCFWCACEQIDLYNKSMGENQEYPDPLFFGRPKTSVPGKRPDTRYADLNPHSMSASHKNGDATVGFQDDDAMPPFSPEAKAILKNFDFDPDRPPPITVIEVHGGEGTKLRLEMTAPIPVDWVEALRKMLDQELFSIVKMLTFGPKHPGILKMIQNQQQGPQQPQYPGEE